MRRESHDTALATEFPQRAAADDDGSGHPTKTSVLRGSGLLLLGALLFVLVLVSV